MGLFGSKKSVSREKTPEIAKIALSPVENTLGFKTDDGQNIMELKKLGEYLAAVDDDVFEKYVDKNKNDIAWWVTNSLGDKALGASLEKLKSSKDMSDEIATRVKELEPFLEGGAKKEETPPATAAEELKNEPKMEAPVTEEEAKPEIEAASTEAPKDDKPDSEKSVAELLAEEGVVATEAAAGSTKDEEKPKSINDVLMTIEKIDGKIEMFDSFRKSNDERVGDLSERIGELRQMLLDRERSFNEVESGFAKMNDTVSDINPIEIKKQLEKSKLELEKRDVKIEKMENQIATLSDEVSGYRKRMNKIKDFDTLIETLNNLKEQVSEISKTKQHSDRLSAKIEHVFAEMNEKVMLFKDEIAKVEKTDAITQELLISVDGIRDKQVDLVSKDDLDTFKKEMQKMEFGVTQEDLSKMIKEIEKEVAKMKESVDLMEFRTKSVSDLMEEKIRSKRYIDKLNKDYEKKKISEDTYLEIIDKAKQRYDEIEETLKRLDRETMYNELNKITKIVNDHIVLFKKTVMGDEFEKLKKSVADVKHKVETANIDKSISILEDAKTNIFSRLATNEKDISVIDLKIKQVEVVIGKLSSLKDDYADFEKLLAGTLSEIDGIKGVLSGIENKIEGDIRQKITHVETGMHTHQHELNQKLKLMKDEIEFSVKDKLKLVSTFSSEIEALREGKSMMFDKMNSNERTLSELNLMLSSLKGELRVISPKISSIENSVSGSFLPDMVSIKSKISDFEMLESDLRSLKLKVEKVIAIDSVERFDELNEELKKIRREIYGTG